jgi:hypothetical protein
MALRAGLRTCRAPRPGPPAGPRGPARRRLLFGPGPCGADGRSPRALGCQAARGGAQRGSRRPSWAGRRLGASLPPPARPPARPRAFISSAPRPPRRARLRASPDGRARPGFPSAAPRLRAHAGPPGAGGRFGPGTPPPRARPEKTPALRGAWHCHWVSGCGGRGRFSLGCWDRGNT